MDEQAAVFVALRRWIGAKLDWARSDERLESMLGQRAQAAFGVALSPVDLGGVDAEKAIALLIGVNGVPIDHGKRALIGRESVAADHDQRGGKRR